MDPRTDTDRFIVEQVQPLLRPQERILVCAYLVPPIRGGRIGIFISAATSMAALAAITTERLVVIQTRIGAFKPLHENHGVVSLERSDIKGAHVGSTLILELSNGRMLEYQDNRSSGKVWFRSESGSCSHCSTCSIGCAGTERRPAAWPAADPTRLTSGLVRWQRSVRTAPVRFRALDSLSLPW